MVGDWTKEEEQTLQNGVKKHGKAWLRIAQDQAIAPSLLRISQPLDQRAFLDALRRKWSTMHAKPTRKPRQAPPKPAARQSSQPQLQFVKAASSTQPTQATGPGPVDHVPTQQEDLRSPSAAAARPRAAAGGGSSADDAIVCDSASDEEGASRTQAEPPAPHLSAPPTPAAAFPSCCVTPRGGAAEGSGCEVVSPASSDGIEAVDPESDAEKAPSPKRPRRAEEAEGAGSRELATVPAEAVGGAQEATEDDAVDALDGWLESAEPAKEEAAPAPQPPPRAVIDVAFGGIGGTRRAAAKEKAGSGGFGPSASFELLARKDPRATPLREGNQVVLRRAAGSKSTALLVFATRDGAESQHGRVPLAEAAAAAPFVALAGDFSGKVRVRAHVKPMRVTAMSYCGERTRLVVCVELRDDLGPGAAADGLRALHALQRARAAVQEAASAEAKAKAEEELTAARAAVARAAEALQFGAWRDYDAAAGSKDRAVDFASRVAPADCPAVIEYGEETAEGSGEYEPLAVEPSGEPRAQLVRVLTFEHDPAECQTLRAVHVPTEVARCGGRLAVRTLPCPAAADVPLELACALLLAAGEARGGYPWSDERLGAKLQQRMGPGATAGGFARQLKWGPAVEIRGRTPHERRKKVAELMASVKPPGNLVLQVGSRATRPQLEALAVGPRSTLEGRLLEDWRAAGRRGGGSASLGLRVAQWVLAANGRLHARLASADLGVMTKKERELEKSLVREIGTGPNGLWWCN